MAKLIFCSEKFAGRIYEIAAQRTTVGRGNANTLSIHDSSVSEHHCELYDNGEDLIVRDLGSRNGTVVNGKLLRNAQAPLAHGQTVQFGSVAARLEIPHLTCNSETTTDVTAVHAHVSKAAHKPAPKNPIAVLDDGSPSENHTLLMSRAHRPTRMPSHSAPETKE